MFITLLDNYNKVAHCQFLANFSKFLALIPKGPSLRTFFLLPSGKIFLQKKTLEPVISETSRINSFHDRTSKEFFFEKTGFFGTHVSLSIPGLITRRYLWQILITAAQWAVARKQRPIHVASQQVTILFPIS